MTTTVQIYQPGTIARYRATIMEQVEHKLMPLEVEICRAGIGQPIRNFNRDQALILAGEVIAKIRTMTGIRGEIDPEIISEFGRLMPRYNGDLTIKEILLAFEMGSQGALDNYLPKNSQGEPDRNHYNRFTIEYATKMLSAFRKRKKETWNQATMLLPPHDEKPSQEEIEQISQNWKRTLLQEFEKVKAGGKAEFFVTSHARDYLQKIGVIAWELEISDEAKAIAKGMIDSGKKPMNKYAILKLHNDNREGKANTNLLFIARTVQEYLDINKAFADLIKNNQELKTRL